jgi:hypothetical protein
MKYVSTLSPEKMIELAGRAVSCKHWRWMPGMRLQDGRRIINVAGAQCFMVASNQAAGWFGVGDSDSEVLPDLDDPATSGCILHLVREIWGEHGLYCGAHKGWWHIIWPDGEGDIDTDYAETEVEAIILALEAAP